MLWSSGRAGNSNSIRAAGSTVTCFAGSRKRLKPKFHFADFPETSPIRGSRRNGIWALRGGATSLAVVDNRALPPSPTSGVGGTFLTFHDVYDVTRAPGRRPPTISRPPATDHPRPDKISNAGTISLDVHHGARV